MKKHFLFLVAVISLLVCNACSSGTGASQGGGGSLLPATHFSVAAQASSTVGAAFNFSVTALDASNNVAAKYMGTVHVTSSDFQAVLSPASATLVNGTGTFSATMNTAGTQTITATDTVAASITGTSPSIDVGAAPSPHFSITAPANATAGTAFNFTVSALDGANNPLTSYSGTISFTSSDSQASLPGNSMLTNGTGSFSATLKTAGNQIVSASDTVTASMNGTSNGINVIPAAATHFSVSTPTYVNSGTAFESTVTALDAWNNMATGYSGIVHFTSTDSLADLPADSSVTNGSSGFSLTLNTVGVQTVTATDTVTSIAGTSGSINVLGQGVLAITSGQPPDGAVGAFYGRVNSVCDTPPYTIDGFLLEAEGGSAIGRRSLSWSGSSLPPGLQVTSIFLDFSPQCIGTIWLIEGTPTTAGTFTFSVTASESTYSGTATYTITIASPQAPAANQGEKSLLPAGPVRSKNSYETERVLTSPRWPLLPGVWCAELPPHERSTTGKSGGEGRLSSCPNMQLVGNSHAPYKILKSRVTAKGIHSGIHPDPWHSSRTFKISCFERLKSLLFFAEVDIDASHKEPTDIAALCERQCPVEELCGLRLLTRAGQG
jgi:hypothetical protein